MTDGSISLACICFHRDCQPTVSGSKLKLSAFGVASLCFGGLGEPRLTAPPLLQGTECL
jgi:hypothetical protein